MKVLIFILNDPDLLEPLLDELSVAGVKGCTIFDSNGMGRQLAKKRPDAFSLIFGSRTNTPTHTTSKTLMMILDEARIAAVTQAIEAVVGSLDQPGSGVLFTFNLDMVKGLKL